MIKIIQKVLPKKLKKKALSVARIYYKKFWEDFDQGVPIYDLEEKHISNLKILTTREEMLNKLPKNGIVAEIGVDQGDFSEKILSSSNPTKLHLVDFWGSRRYNQLKRKSVEEKFKKLISDGKVEINLGLSTDVVETFSDNYFDWIYIDTDHSYKTTIQELNKYSKKIKSKGIIAGHDFIIGNWNTMSRYGVIEAVNEFCVKNNWEIIYLTIEKSTSPSFAIKKI